MENKIYTILIASNRHGDTIRLHIRASWIKVLGFLGFCGLLLTATAGLDYLGLLLKANENRMLKNENTNLKAQFQTAEQKLSSLEASVERIQNFTKKLNLITNVEDEERVLKLALSPATRAGAGNDAQQGPVSRLPSSEFMIRDPQVQEKLFVDEKT